MKSKTQFSVIYKFFDRSGRGGKEMRTPGQEDARRCRKQGSEEAGKWGSREVGIIAEERTSCSLRYSHEIDSLIYASFLSINNIFLFSTSVL